LAALIPVATLILVSLAGAALFLLFPPETGPTDTLMTAVVLGGSIVGAFFFLASVWPERFITLLFKGKVFGDVALRFYLPESLRLGGTLLAPLNLAILLWSSGLVLLRRHLLKPYWVLLLPLVPFVAWQVLALGIRPSVAGLTKLLAQQWIPLILLTTLVSSLTIKDLRPILTGTQIAVAIMLSTVFTEWLVGWPVPVTDFDADVAWSQGRTVRFGGIWGIRSKGAESWAEISYIISLSTLIMGRRRPTDVLHLANIGYCCLAVALTGSKTPVVVLTACTIVLVLLARNVARGMILSVVVIVTGAVVSSTGVFDRTAERFDAEQVRFEENTTRDGLGTGRFGTWTAALANWQAEGLVTMLIGGGPLSSVDFVNSGDRLGNEKDHGIHSQHLSILVELGIIGMACYILFWVGLIRMMKKPEDASDDASLAQLIVAGIMTGLWVRGLTVDVLNAVYYTWYLVIPIALLTKLRVASTQQNGSH